MKNNKNLQKSFNLLQSGSTNKTFIEKLYDWAINVGRYIVIGTELVVLVAFGVRFVLDQNLNNLDTNVSNANDTFKANYATTQKTANNIASEVALLKSSSSLQVPTSEILQNISNAASSTGVNITTIQTENTLVTLSGTAPSPDTITNFRKSLEDKYQSVSTIEIIDNSSKDQQSTNTRNKFTLNFKYAQTLSTAN